MKKNNEQKKHTYVRKCTTFNNLLKFTKKVSFDIN